MESTSRLWLNSIDGGWIVSSFGDFGVCHLWRAYEVDSEKPFACHPMTPSRMWYTD